MASNSFLAALRSSASPRSLAFSRARPTPSTSTTSNSFVSRFHHQQQQLKGAAQRRFASSNTSEKAQEKAQEALAGARKGLESAAKLASRIGGGVGERVGSLLGSYREPLLYNLSVAREVLKQVYVAERLAPPTSFSTVTGAYQALWARASNPTYWREIMRSGEWQRVGLYAVEAYGIFKIGEILGRRHLVGYKLE